MFDIMVVPLCNSQFTFYCAPYLLKLTFNEALAEDEEKCRATYDPNVDNGTITASLPKLIKGQTFTDLDMISHLLQRRLDSDRMHAGPPLVEVVNACDGLTQQGEVDCTTDSEMNSAIHTGSYRYGFDSRYYDVFKSSGDHFEGLLELPNPEQTDPVARRALRKQVEGHLFDAERYLGDLFGSDEDDYYLQAMSFSPPWNRLWDAWRVSTVTAITDALQGTALTDSEGVIAQSDGAVTGSTPDDMFQNNTNFGFSEEDNSEMQTEVSRKPFLAPNPSDVAIRRRLLYCLSDIIFAYCYDFRINAGDPSVESAFNICRLSCTLSWLEDYNYDGCVLHDVIAGSVRRSLIYPYCRNWKLSKRVLADVAKILLCGRRTVLQCLLRLHRIFRRTSTHYLINKLYILDFCLWAQSLSSSVFEAFGQEYNATKGSITKNDIELNIPAIEATALAAIEKGVVDLDCEEESSETSSTSSCTSDDSDGDSTEVTVSESVRADIECAKTEFPSTSSMTLLETGSIEVPEGQRSEDNASTTKSGHGESRSSTAKIIERSSVLLDLEKVL